MFPQMLHKKLSQMLWRVRSKVDGLGSKLTVQAVKLVGPNDLKCTLLGQSERSKRLKVNGPKDSKWTILKSKCYGHFVKLQKWRLQTKACPRVEISFYEIFKHVNGQNTLSHSKLDKLYPIKRCLWLKLQTIGRKMIGSEIEFSKLQKEKKCMI